MRQTIDETLRQAVRCSETSINSLAKRAGIPQPVLHRFFHGAGINLHTADKLAKVFGLRLTNDLSSK